MSKRVSIGDLKARLSEYIAAAKAGESVLITDRGRPVARLAPLSGSGALEGRAAHLVRAGLARPPRRRLDRRFLEAERPADTKGRALESMLEERAEGW